MEMGDSHLGVTLPTFSNLLHARYIAAHGCLSHWGRLRWLLDWQQIAQAKKVDWQTLIDSSASTKESGYIKKAFLLANQQFQLLIPEPINALKTPFGSHYSISKQCKSQAKAQYPGWLSRQVLNFLNQENLQGMAGYGRHMLKKLMAAKTLKTR